MKLMVTNSKVITLKLLHIKKHLHTLFYLFLKSLRAFSLSLISHIWLFDFVAVDPDNDYIKCRMADGPKECGGICNGLRNASLDGVSILYRRYTASAIISSYYVFGIFLQKLIYIS